MKGDFANDDFLVRRKQDVDVLFAGNSGDDFGLVWDGYKVDSWVAECDHIFPILYVFGKYFFWLFSWYMNQNSVSVLTRLGLTA